MCKQFFLGLIYAYYLRSQTPLLTVLYLARVITTSMITSLKLAVLVLLWTLLQLTKPTLIILGIAVGVAVAL